MISIIIIVVSFATKPFYITLIHSFIRCYFEYLPLSNLQFCRISLTRFNYLKNFWTGPFVSPSVKVTYTLWKVYGIIYGFKYLRRNIYSGVEKSEDNSMGSISFQTTPQVYFPHSSCVFSNPDQLGT